MDVVGRKMAQQELPPLFLQVAGARVDDEDAVAARRHEEPAARHAVGHLEDLDDVGDVLGPALVAQFVAVEGVVVRVEQVEAAGRGDPHRAVDVLDDVVDGIAGDGIGILAVALERLEVHAVEADQAAFRADPDDPAPVLADLVDLRVGESVVRRIEPRGLPGNRPGDGQKGQERDNGLNFHYLSRF